MKKFHKQFAFVRVYSKSLALKDRHITVTFPLGFFSVPGEAVNWITFAVMKSPEIKLLKY